LLISARVDAALGASASDVSNQVIVAQGSLIRACLIGAGFSLESTDIPTPLPSSAKLSNPNHIGDQVARARRGLDAKRFPPTSPPDPARRMAVESCYKRARDEVVNPFTSFYEWWLSQTAQIDSSFAADRRTISANEALKSCLSLLGYNVDSDVDLRNSFVDRVTQILSEAADLHSQVVNEKLNIVQKEEEALAPKANRCIDDRDAVTERVRAELEQRWAEANADALAEHFRDLRLKAQPYVRKISATVSSTPTSVTS
jgi:hypothetical protein